MSGCRNAEMAKELDGSRQMMIKKQSEIDQLQNEVVASALSSLSACQDIDISCEQFRSDLKTWPFV